MIQVIKKFIKDIRPDLSEEEVEKEAHILEVMIVDRLAEIGDWKDKIVMGKGKEICKCGAEMCPIYLRKDLLVDYRCPKVRWYNFWKHSVNRMYKIKKIKS
jgi:hypothetical protein